MNRLRALIPCAAALSAMPTDSAGCRPVASRDSVPNTARPACCRAVRGLCTSAGRLRITGLPFSR